MRRTPQSGFSLIELLVVLTIIAIFVGVAMLSVGVTGSDRESEREVFRLRSLIDLVREEALLQGRDFGLLFSEGAYVFYEYDYGQLAWIRPVDDGLLAPHELTDPLELTLSVEDREVILDEPPDLERNETVTPQVMILSTGEVTPFTAEVFRDFMGGHHTLTAEFDGSMEIEAVGY